MSVRDQIAASQAACADPSRQAPLEDNEAWLVNLVWTYVKAVESDPKSQVDAFDMHDRDKDGAYGHAEMTSFLSSAKVAGFFATPERVASKIFEMLKSGDSIHRNQLISYLACAVQRLERTKVAKK